ncbi:MAG: hypothetical protein ACFFBD_27755 [Candidatus Hodarchaeota archaeon]
MAELTFTEKVFDKFGFLDFLFGSRERLIFSVWYVIVLAILLLLKTFTPDQWNLFLGGDYYDLLETLGWFIVLFSAFYWLFMAVLASLNPGSKWPLLPAREIGWKGIIFYLILNILVFIGIAVPVYLIYTSFREVFELITLFVYVVWAIISVYFVFYAFQNLIFKVEERFRPIPKPTKIPFIIIAVLAIGVLIPLPAMWLISQVYQVPFLESLTILDENGILSGYITLLAIFTLISFFMLFYHRLIDLTKIKYIPIFHLIGLSYFLVIALKTIFFDIDNAILRAWSLIVNLIFVVIILFLGLRRIAQIVGPLVPKAYIRRLNPRTLTLFVFYITAIYLVIIDFQIVLNYTREAFQALNFSRVPFSGIFDGIRNFFVNLMLGGWSWLFFILFSPVAYFLFFLTSDFIGSPDPSP